MLSFPAVKTNTGRETEFFSRLLNELRSDQVLQVEGLVPFFLREELALFNNNLRAGLITIDEFIAQKGAAANEDCAAVDIYINGRW